MTTVETTARIIELRDAYQRERIEENRRLKNENKRLRAEVEYLERVVIPAMLRANGTVVIPRRTLNPRGSVYAPKVIAEQNAAGDVILKLEK